MNILYLGPPSPLIKYLLSDKDSISLSLCNKILREWQYAFRAQSHDWIVSYGYRYILPQWFLDKFPNRVVNCHIGYLPFGRGASPNLFAWLNQEPHGVTLHYIDAGVDTGDIIGQEQVVFANPELETLATSYQVLQDAMVDLFKEYWPLLKAGNAPRKPQEGKGTYHTTAEANEILSTLPDGWDTPVSVLENYRVEH